MMDISNLATSMVAFTVLGLTGSAVATADEQSKIKTTEINTVQVNELGITLFGIDTLDEMIIELQGEIELEKIKQQTIRVAEWAEADAFAEKQLLLDGLLAELFSYVGKTPYGFGDTPARWDCSGLTKWYLAQRGVEVVHSATAQIQGKALIDAPLPGDLVGFKKYGSSEYFHIGVYIGGGMMIHSANPNKDTAFQSITEFADSENSIAVFVRY